MSSAALRTPRTGVLVYRWASLVWMGAVVALYPGGFDSAWLAWSGLAVAAAWTAWLTTSRTHNRTVLAADLTVAVALVLLGGVVVGSGQVGGGRPFYATAYPLAAALAWGLETGPRGGLVAGALLAAAVGASRPLNGIDLQELSRGELQGTVNGMVSYLLAGWAAGVVGNLLRRSAEAAEHATAELLRERERAGRAAERESMARQIHDSVLQVLALLHKRLEAGAPTRDEAAELADLAAREETALRRLIMREPEDPPSGRASLRDALEQAGADVQAVDVTVTAVGPIWLPRHATDEIAAAVRQALANVVRHAGASRVTVFADEEDDAVRVSVRDDGRGFVYDPETLRADGKAGILMSIKGRIEDLGGTMRVSTAPGRGTEIELEVRA